MGLTVRTLLLLSAIASLAFFCGCAHVWVDVEGTRHIVGLMHLTLPSTQPHAAAETFRFRTLGLTWSQADVGSALVLGYSDTTFGFLRNNVCVAIDRTQLETSQ